ncbi:MAG: hypothetical protein IPM39_06385 [Chloroflexi bacterium]|nr:hypothetical protein [Chloroflexota bacterium]
MGKQQHNSRQLWIVWWMVTAVLLTAVSACRPTAPTATPIVLPTNTAAALVTPAALPTAYPAPETAVPMAPPYPAPVTAVPSAPYPAPPLQPGSEETYLPYVGQDGAATATPLPSPSPSAMASAMPSPTPSPTPIPTVDFAAVRADLQAQGQDLAFVKIGFHVGVGGNTDGLDEWMDQLDAAGVPFFLKSVDNAQPLYIAQEMMRQSGVPHILVFRKVAGGNHVSVPNYNLPPEAAAQQHWRLHTDDFPPELDPSLVWMETMNEVDKNRSEWLAQFALTTAELALRDGRKWAAFGWSAGEPEPADWESPVMLQFLRLLGDHPDQLAIAVHEYSYNRDDIGDGFPYKIGRFLEIFRVADKYGIPRPTILITEWGWTYEHVPEPAPAIADIAWAARFYAPYPQIKGAAIWYLGSGDTFAEIAEETQRLITPLRIYALTTYFAIPQSPEQAALDAEAYRP